MVIGRKWSAWLGCTVLARLFTTPSSSCFGQQWVASVLAYMALIA